MGINPLDMVYEAILGHDTKFDGIYYVGIKSTGIFCRPSCRSRTPKKENIVVFDSIESAEKAGFRACKRCRPDDPGRHGPDAQLAGRLKDLVQKSYDRPLTLAGLAAELNVSQYHLQRVFKRIIGITPARYLHDLRMEQARQLLERGDLPIREIAFGVGFRSLSHFASAFQKANGSSPLKYRDQVRRPGS